MATQQLSLSHFPGNVIKYFANKLRCFKPDFELCLLLCYEKDSNRSQTDNTHTRKHTHPRQKAILDYRLPTLILLPSFKHNPRSQRVCGICYLARSNTVSEGTPLGEEHKELLPARGGRRRRGGGRRWGGWGGVVWRCQFLRGAPLRSQLLFDSYPCTLTPRSSTNPPTAGVQGIVAKNIVHLLCSVCSLLRSEY